MEDGATENIRTYGLYNGKPAISVQVFQQPGANIVEVVDAVKAELPLLKASIDPKIDLVVTFDRSIDHPRLAAAGGADPAAGGGDGHPRRLHVSAQLSRGARARAGRSGLTDRNVRGHVPPRLHARQLLAHGADHRHGIRGR